MTDSPKRYVAYGRFSTDKQNEKSASDQIALCDEKAKTLGWYKVKDYADQGLSADSMRQRKNLQALLKDAGTGNFDVLVVESMDRVSRRPSDGHFIYEMLQFNDVSIFSLMDNDFINDMHMAWRMYESSQQIKKTKYNVKRGQAAAVSRGVLVGKLPYGYRVVRSTDAPRGVRAVNETEAKVVQRVFNEYAAGMSPVEIVQRLNDEGVPSPDKKKWRQSSLFGNAARSGGMLTNPHYKGIYRWGITETRRNPATQMKESRKNDASKVKEIVLPSELRIIDDELWNAVQEKVNARRCLPLPRRKLPKHVLSGLAVCGNCGNTYTVSDSRRLACSGRVEMGYCDNRRRVDRAELEDAVLGLLAKSLLSPELVESYLKTYRSEHKRLFGQVEADTAALRKRIEKSRQELDRLVSALANAETEDTARGVLLAAIRGRNTELEKLEEELATSKIPQLPVYNAAEIVGRLQEQLGALRDHVSADSPDAARARETVRSLIDRIVIRPEGEEDGRGCGPVTVEIEGRIEAFLGLAENRTDRVVQLALGTEYRLSHAIWRASVKVENTDKTQKITPPKGSDGVRDFLSIAVKPATVEELIHHLLESDGLDCSNSNIHMAKQRAQRSLNYLRHLGEAVAVPVPGWRKYLWALAGRKLEFWPDNALTTAGNYSDTKKVLEVLSKARQPISVTQIVDEVVVAMGERPRTKRARYLGTRIRACLHFHREQGTVLQIVYEDRKQQLWLLTSRKKELLPDTVVQLNGRAVNRSGVLSILEVADGPLTAPEIAEMVLARTGEMQTERNRKRTRDRVRGQLRGLRAKGLVEEVSINGSRFHGWILNSSSKPSVSPPIDTARGVPSAQLHADF